MSLCSDLDTETLPLVKLRRLKAFSPGSENPYQYSNSEIHSETPTNPTTLKFYSGVTLKGRCYKK